MVIETGSRVRLGRRLRTAALVFFFGCAVGPGPASAQSVMCDMSRYAAVDGLAAEAVAGGVRAAWRGDAGQSVRLHIAVRGGTPVIQDLSLRRGDGPWTSIVTEAVPEFAVVTGLRRISNQQLAPLRGLKVPITKEAVDAYRWDPFWDAPLDTKEPPATGRFANSWSPRDGVPAAGQPGLPRDPAEIGRASVVYKVTGCTVRTDGARMIIDFPGVELGVFSGSLRYTIFRGTNMVRQEMIGRTARDWVAYKYDAGLKGLAIAGNTRVAWRDTSNTWQESRLSGPVNAAPVPLRAANRVMAVEQGGGTVAVFPPPHRFFWAREVAVNVGYNWYRKDEAGSFSFGVRQNEHEDFAHEEFQANWALYSARPGTDQQMTVFLYPALGDAPAAVEGALAFTNGDRYRPLPGFQVMNHHYHMDMGARLLREGSPDVKLQDLVALKALGLNIVSPIDTVQLTLFTESGELAVPADPGEALKRRREQNERRLAVTRMSVAGAKAHSDETFLILPSQEIFRGPLGGHTDLLFSRPVYWDERLPGQPFEEKHPQYGKLYHIGSADDFMRMVTDEHAIVSMPHPRSKGSTGFPDAVKDRPYFRSPHYHGFGARWGMGLDGSETRLCEYRCWPLLDDMSNWLADTDVPLKRVLSISEVMGQSPGDDIYGSAPVTYVRLARLPPPDDVTPLIDALMKGYAFWTTGEVLVPAFEVRGRGRQARIVADVAWTFPLDFVEVVWGDGRTTGREIVPATALAPFGAHRFEIPFDATGKKWVRFAAWDSAANGAVLQPVRLPR